MVELDLTKVPLNKKGEVHVLLYSLTCGLQSRGVFALVLWFKA
jgi:hypothetical protein